jgi:hypothetical protein
MFLPHAPFALFDPSRTLLLQTTSFSLLFRFSPMFKYRRHIAI